jgi:hypothetical protein
MTVGLVRRLGGPENAGELIACARILSELLARIRFLLLVDRVRSLVGSSASPSEWLSRRTEISFSGGSDWLVNSSTDGGGEDDTVAVTHGVASGESLDERLDASSRILALYDL